MNADRFLTVPFLSRGRSYDGADCWGLVWLYHRDMLGIGIDDWAEVPARSLRRISRLIAEHKRAWRVVTEPRDGDVVVMRSLSAGGPITDTHVGVVVNRRFVLHTEEQTGARLERLSAPHVAARIMEFRRHPSAV
jgi:cell wall-associated NlpC family hydrolase